MMHVLAAEGGYQAFHLGGAEWFWLIFAAATAILAIVVGLVLVRGVLARNRRGAPRRNVVRGARARSAARDCSRTRWITGAPRQAR